MEVNRQIPITSASSVVSNGGSVAPQLAAVNRAMEVSTSTTEQQELQSLSLMIKTWRELNKEASSLKEQVREKTKRLKALDEMILRIMKKHNIGALDLKESGGRILYRRSASKAGLTPKTLMTLLSEHLKSEDAASNALKYINEHREARVRESLLYERE
jgi:hypothetical protein